MGTLFWDTLYTIFGHPVYISGHIRGLEHTIIDYILPLYLHFYQSDSIDLGLKIVSDVGQSLSIENTMFADLGMIREQLE